MSDHERRTSASLAGLLARDDWPVLVALPAVASLFVFAVPTLGWWAYVAAFGVYGAGFIGFERHRATEAAHRELAVGLGRIAELAALAPAGHTVRAPQLAGEVARRLELRSAVTTSIEHAAAMRSIGRVAVEGRDDLTSSAAERLAARRSAAIVAHAGTLARLAPLLAPEAPVRDTPAQARAAVDLAAAYDEAVAWRGCDPTETIDHLADAGRADVVRALRVAVAAAPD